MNILLIAFGFAFIIALTAFVFFADLLGLLPKRKERDELTPRSGFLENIRVDLAEAGIRGMSPERFLIYSGSFGVLVALLIMVLTRMWMVAGVFGVLVGLFGLQSFYIKPLAERRHRKANEHVAEACRMIAQTITAGTEPNRALEMYARRSDRRSLTRDLTGHENQIATAFQRAINEANQLSISRSKALTKAANEFGNYHFIQMIEVFNQNTPIGPGPTAAALLKQAREIDFAIMLQNERETAVAQPLNTYRLVGVITFALTFYVGLMSEASADYFTSFIGQAIFLGMVAWWGGGYKLLSKNLSSR